MRPTAVAPLLLWALACGACSDDTPALNTADLSATMVPGGPVAGAPDTHCAVEADGGAPTVVVSMAHCTAPPGTPGIDPDYGPPLFGTVGDDDDCKYHVRYSVSPVTEHTAVTFSVTTTTLADGMPAVGGNAFADVQLSDTHPANTSGSSTVEAPPGTYTIGPVVFDAAGRWTVRFHLFQTCTDFYKDSPHGHVAFYVQVP